MASNTQKGVIKLSKLISELNEHDNEEFFLLENAIMS